MQYLWQQIYGLVMSCVNNVLLQSAVLVHLRAHFFSSHSKRLIGISITFSLKPSFYEVYQLIFLQVMYLSAGDHLILLIYSVPLYLSTDDQNDSCSCRWKHTLNLKDCMALSWLYLPHLNWLRIIKMTLLSSHQLIEVE